MSPTVSVVCVSGRAMAPTTTERAVAIPYGSANPTSYARWLAAGSGSAPEFRVRATR